MTAQGRHAPKRTPRFRRIRTVLRLLGRVCGWTADRVVDLAVRFAPSRLAAECAPMWDPDGMADQPPQPYEDDVPSAQAAVQHLHRAQPGLPYTRLTWTYRPDGARAVADPLDGRAQDLRGVVASYAGVFGSVVVEHPAGDGRTVVATYATHLGVPVSIEVLVAEADEGPLRFESEAHAYVEQSDTTERFAAVLDGSGPHPLPQGAA